MALSAKNAQALEQVKMNLLKLYGAEYFTEDEWIKLDGLIHKGQYVFTPGPPNANLLEEELMTFDDFHDNTELDPTKGDNVITTERDIPSPVSSESAEIIDASLSSPNQTSAENSDDETTKKSIESNDMFDFSETTAPASAPAPAEPTPSILPKPSMAPADIPKRESKPLPAEGGLALGYTQAQIDELKAYNAKLTKAGEKKRPKYSRVEESPSEADWEDHNPSPTATEQDNRVQSWALEVNHTQQSTARIVSPAPTNPQEGIVEQFVRVYGRSPRTVNDIAQPNNPQFRPLDQRPTSRASSSKTTKSAAKHVPTIPAPKDKLGERLNVAPGTVLVAQRKCGARGIQIEVNFGDKIKLLKHVSGVMYNAKNLHTGQSGQVSENIFRRLPDTLIEQQRAMAIAHSRKTPAPPPTLVTAPSETSNGLDRFERMNAREWDEESAVSRQTAVPAGKPKFDGLSSSRFAILADESKKVSTDKLEFMPGLSREEVGKLVDEKFAQMFAAQEAAKTARPLRSKTPFKPEPLKPIVPKTNTCWFWSTGKGCRFTAEECRDAHEQLPNSDSSNLRAGKPTWGPIADSLLAASPSLTSASQFYNPSTSAFSCEKGKRLTCWYWATTKSCTNSAEDCKFAHEQSPLGVAPRPRQSINNWSRWTTDSKGKAAEENAWGESQAEGSGRSGWGEGVEEGEAIGDFVLEEVEEDGAGGRDEDENANDDGPLETIGQKKYKPPHVRAETTYAPAW